MRKTILMFVVAVAALHVGSAETTCDAQTQNEEVLAKLARIDQFVWNAPLFLRDKSLQGARNLAKIQHEDIKQVPNKFIPNQMVEYRTLVFDGLELYGRVTPNQEFRPVRVTITKSMWKLREGLDVGTSADRIELVLGSPIEKDKNVLRFQGESERVDFYIHGNKITKVELIYYAD